MESIIGEVFDDVSFDEFEEENLVSRHSYYGYSLVVWVTLLWLLPYLYSRPEITVDS